MSDRITRENILDKLRLHPPEQTPQVCMIAGQEIARLRAEVERKDEALRDAIAWLDDVDGSYINVDQRLVEKITAALADTADKQGEQT